MKPRSLDSYFRRELQHHVFPGCDAAVAFVPEGQSPGPEIQIALERAGRQRWYPVPGGHEAKAEYHSIAGHEHLFRLEKGGWDHEHCDFCSQSIPAGQTCWTTSDRDFAVFCEQCYEKLRKE